MFDKCWIITRLIEERIPQDPDGTIVIMFPASVPSGKVYFCLSAGDLIFYESYKLNHKVWIENRGIIFPIWFLMHF